MKDLRIVFMGTPEFAVATLDRLIQHSYTIVGVITAPDRPAGRGRKLQESAVKKYAVEHDLNVMQPVNLKNRDFLKELKSLKANLQIVVAFRMLPKAVWQMPELGTFNLHASLLPNYRGAAPINWAIINGEKETGVTTFFIDEKIDTGAIILRERTPIGPHETAGELHDRLMVLGADLVLRTVQRIEDGTVLSKVQESNDKLSSAPKIHRETCRVDWEQPIDRIYNFIRGLSPYPTAWTTLVNGDEIVVIKIYEAAIHKQKHQYKSGTIFSDKKEMKVAVKGGLIELLEIQLPGKKRMQIVDVLNGLKLAESAFVS